MKKFLSVAFLALALATACKKEVTMQENPVTTLDVTIVSAISTEFRGESHFWQGGPNREVGFQYSTNADFSDSKEVKATFDDRNSFYCQIRYLTPSTHYYFRAYLLQGGAYTYGNTKEFTTSPLSTLIETLNPIVEDSGHVRLKGRLSLQGVHYGNILDYGFYAGTSEGQLDRLYAGSLYEEDYYCSDYLEFSPGQLYFKAFVTLDGNTYYAEVKSFDNPMPEIVDLGLSVKWRGWNLGASSMTDFGDYYAWGELSPYYKSLDPIDWEDGKQAGYAWGSYGLCDGSSNTLTRYVTRNDFGTVDGRTMLVPLSDDPANKELGEFWRIPTPEEWEELRVGCECSLESVDGVPGVKFTSRLNGRWIFIPAAGNFSGLEIKESGTIGDYWSAKVDVTNPSQATVVEFGSDYFAFQTKDRCIGLPIRPVVVSKPYVPVERISTPTPAFTLLQWDPGQAKATVIPEDADEKTIIWSSSDESVVWVSQSGEVKAVSLGTATLTATCGGVTKEIPVYVVEDAPFVDLGVSAKWAPYNLCESGFVDAVTDWGDFYAWGELEPHYSSIDPLTWKNGYSEGYTWSNYKWCNGSSSSLTKYGTVDGRYVLEMGPDGDDAASRKLGLGWRIPTKEDWQELLDQCNWAWWSIDGQPGYKVTSRKDSSKWIFMPLCGYIDGDYQKDKDFYGVYWSSTVSSNDSGAAWTTSMSTALGGLGTYYRCTGLPIRPVTN